MQVSATLNEGAAGRRPTLFCSKEPLQVGALILVGSPC